MMNRRALMTFRNMTHLKLFNVSQRKNNSIFFTDIICNINYISNRISVFLKKNDFVLSIQLYSALWLLNTMFTRFMIGREKKLFFFFLSISVMHYGRQTQRLPS
jgi:hypothetical protein